jgi:lysine 2,3-aminomutase
MKAASVESVNLSELIVSDNHRLVDIMWSCDPVIHSILKNSSNLHDARSNLLIHLDNIEKHLFNIYSYKFFKDLNILEKKNAKECIRILKTIIRTENERITGFSALKLLFKIAKKSVKQEKVHKGFLIEFIHLFKGINGNSGLYSEKDLPLFFKLSGKEAALERTKFLDNYSSKMEAFLSKYKTGLDPELVQKRETLKRDILDYFGASEEDWKDYRWHIKNIIYSAEILTELVKLDERELKGLKLAEQYQIPVHITPYYLSLFDKDNTRSYDAAIRAQVLPSARYCKNLIESRKTGASLDFMDEQSTSPIEGITRRYPQILILKPYDSCPQICVYCQRNWEIKDIRDAELTGEKMKNAIQLIEENPHITEVLITGGDPLTIGDRYIDKLLQAVSRIEHIERIRIGTRTLVTLPFRITDSLADIFEKYQLLGERELCIITHFEHSTELTPDSLNCIKKLKNKGINIYNQQVFTYYTSRKFETCKLRKVLKKSGIDPYYTFNTKGKEETIDYRVPIARIEQEQKEEARLLPGVVRTDEPVFNVPRLGKSHLRAGQDHEIIMILPDGRRVYRFYPWESKFELVEPYNYTDVSIYEYLRRLHEDGENIDEYKSIWYYF